MQLTDHFSLVELTCTDTGLPNNPLPHEIDNLKELAKGLESVRKLFNKPIDVSSGFRSAAANKAVGGAYNSAHLSGYAADITIQGLTNKEICEEIVKSDIQFDQLIDEDKNGRQWVHISFDPQLRGQWLVFSNGQYETHK